MLNAVNCFAVISGIRQTVRAVRGADAGHANGDRLMQEQDCRQQQERHVHKQVLHQRSYSRAASRPYENSSAMGPKHVGHMER